MLNLCCVVQVLYCNGPSPGSTFQRWHRDSATDFYDLPQWLVRQNGDPMAIGVNIPLVDRDAVNGATDVVPGTRLAIAATAVAADSGVP